MPVKSPISTHTNVINAHFLREMQTRFGSQKLGYLWVFIDSIAQIVVLAGIKAVLFDRSMPGVDFAVFLAIGILAFNMFKSIVFRSMDAFSANKGLFVYKQVKPIDALITRAMVEFLIYICALIALSAIGLYFNFDVNIQNIMLFVGAYIWIAIFGLSLGITFAILAEFFENLKKVVKLIFLPLFFISGIFFSVESLPLALREWLLYNPVLHFMELIHGSYFSVLDTHYVDYQYMFFWTVIPLFTGLFLYQRTYKVILTS